jgi:rhodanese-related sulfurtransferase
MPLDDFIVSNWPLFLALVIILVMLARSWIGPDATRSVGPTEVTRLINHDDAVVLDVRTDKEFQEGHILNALHVPLGMLDNRMAELQSYKTHSVVVACRTGAHSARASRALRKQGFQLVHTLAGGMLAWTGANLPVTSAPSRPLKPAESQEAKPDE